MTHSYIGLISGTSMDGIDAVLASFENESLQLHATHAHAYPGELGRLLQNAVKNPESCSLEQLGMLDRWTGECFRDAALAVIEKSSIKKSDVVAIGSHGQTLRHQPDGEYPFSLQVGDAAIIAADTGITTIADFRRADIAAGGQGAPLTPAFHQWLLRSHDTASVVLNIGGIANITVLPAGNEPVIGFDTGPGNTLLDTWINAQRGQPYDDNGQWSASGAVVGTLLDKLATDNYFGLAPPKSTGFEYFNLAWLNAYDAENCEPTDVQATLCELSAVTIAAAIQRHAPATRAVYVCGGGVHNADLMQRIRRNLSETDVSSTQDVGLDPDWVEAAAFAWLAMRTTKNKSGNLPSVTGASRRVVLGAIHSP
ncbi:MAG: anhydro-N-acetylmuramic acid kinase [Gammaproteobacteria bacterium]|nr:anhydro-N-acetylmuramic acid kinase [Gammaproteobacteria bacterium]